MANLGIVASVAEIIAALGVIISVIYLAIQVRDANRVARQQAYKDTLDLMHSPIEQFVENSDLAETIRRGGVEPDQLSDTEWFQYGYWWMMQFNMYDFLYLAHLDGTAVPSLWVGTDSSWRHVFQNEPGVRRAWREWRHAFADPFQSYIDSVVKEAEQADR